MSNLEVAGKMQKNFYTGEIIDLQNLKEVKKEYCSTNFYNLKEIFIFKIPYSKPAFIFLFKKPRVTFVGPLPFILFFLVNRFCSITPPPILFINKVNPCL
jgi:hypothetical protein